MYFFIIIMLWNTQFSGIFIFWPSCIMLYDDKWFCGLNVLIFCKLNCLKMDRDVVESWVPCAEMAWEEFLYEKKKKKMWGQPSYLYFFWINKIDYCLDLSDVIVWVKDTKLTVMFSFKNLLILLLLPISPIYGFIVDYHVTWLSFLKITWSKNYCIFDREIFSQICRWGVVSCGIRCLAL